MKVERRGRERGGGKGLNRGERKKGVESRKGGGREELGEPIGKRRKLKKNEVKSKDYQHESKGKRMGKRRGKRIE